MKNWRPLFFRISPFVLIALIIISSCKEDEPSEDPAGLATITTMAVDDISSFDATSGGNISSDGGAAITLRGLVWGTAENPTTAENEGISSEGEGSDAFTSSMTNLLPYTTYFVRAYATNSAGTAYGNQLEFETLPEGAFSTVTDIDGNVYWTVALGDNEFMAQNLRTTRYSDGTAIPTGLSDEEWSNTNEGAYTIYPYNDTIGSTRAFEPVLELDDYGYLYNGWAAIYGNPCPEGWHVPSNEEWQSSIDWVESYYNLYNYEVGDALKSCRQVNSPLGGGCKTIWHPRWNEDDQAYGTNRAFFLALPSGHVNTNHGYSGIGKDVHWWTSSINSASYTQFIGLLFDNSGVLGGASPNNYGYSIRCYRPLLKDK